MTDVAPPKAEMMFDANFLPASAVETKHEFVSGDGYKLWYLDTESDRRSGNDPRQQCVLLIHGWFTSSRMWKNLPPVNTNIIGPLVSAGFRVVAMDCRGHGLSDKPLNSSEYGMKLVKDQVELLDHLAIEQVHVCGASMGAEIALKLTLTNPQRVRSLIVAGTGWSHDFAGDQGKRSWYAQSYGDLVNPCTMYGCVVAMTRACWYPCCCPCIWKKMQGEVPYVPSALACGKAMEAVMEVSEDDMQHTFGSGKIPICGIAAEKDEERPYVERIGTVFSGDVAAAWSLTVVAGKDHDGLFMDPTWHAVTVEFIKKCAIS